MMISVAEGIAAPAAAAAAADVDDVWKPRETCFRLLSADKKFHQSRTS